MTRIDVLHRGDEVLAATPEQITVRRKNGEVDLIPLMTDQTGLRIDPERIVRIGYGNNTVTAETDLGVELINF